jgi:RNA polymerase sigma-70 factor, ECF subfamily
VGKKMGKTRNNHKFNNQDYVAPTVEEICSTTWESLYLYIYYKVRSREVAEDITQETYLKAVPHILSEKVNPDKYIGFLRTVALNLIRDRWRKNKRRGTSVNLDSVYTEEITTEDPTNSIPERILIENALNQLNPIQRNVIELRILKGYSIAETAMKMKKKETTIRVIQHRALKTLASILKNQDKEE